MTWLQKILARFGKVEVPDAPHDSTPLAATSAAPPPPVAGRRKIEVWVDEPMLVSAREVCLMVDTGNPDASPEAKHAMAFARLSRLYPEVAKRDVALAIELGLRS
jgi:hypothetical protein